MSNLMYLIFHLVRLDSACHCQSFFQVHQFLSHQQRAFSHTGLHLTDVRCFLVLGGEGAVETSEGSHR